MAIVWADGFDYYGTNVSLIANAGYSTVGGLTLRTDIVRTGSVSLYLFGDRWLIRPLDNPGVSVLGQGAGYNVQTVPGVGNAGSLFTWYGQSGAPNLYVGTDGRNGITVSDSTGTVRGVSAPNIVYPSAFYWIEAKATCNTSGGVDPNTGSVEVRVNGNPVLTVNGINIPGTFYFHGIGRGLNTNSGIIDDWIVWDNTGATNNDFSGDRRLVPLFPNANGPTQNFIPSSGNAYDRINDNPPVDTSYIQGLNPGDISNFSKAAIPILATDIAAVMLWGRVFKTDAGTASVRLGIESGAFVANSNEKFPGTSGTYQTAIVETDPNGGVRWTRAAVDAALLRITRQQ